MPAIVASWNRKGSCCAFEVEAATVNIAHVTDVAMKYRTAVLPPDAAGCAPFGSPPGPSLPREVEIPDLVVGRRAEPHPALVVHEEVAQRILRVRERIFDDLAGVGVEASDHVHVFGRVPDLD